MNARSPFQLSAQRWFCKTLGALAFTLMGSAVPAAAWEPTQPVEFIVPAGTGGGADQMARVMQGIITKHNLSKQSAYSGPTHW